MGPIAGLAAGLGIAALMSHLGLGAEFGNIIMMRAAGGRRLRRDPLPDAPLRPRTGGASAACSSPAPARRSRRRRCRSRRAAGQFRGCTGPSAPRAAARRSPHAAPTARPALPAGFDAAGFERIAKMIFIRLQAANDSRRPERPARLHDAGDVRGDQARPAGARRRRRSAPTSSASTPRCSTSRAKPSARSSASASTA